MSKLEVNTLAPQTGTTITIGESGDTVALGSGASQTGFGGTNTPAFAVVPSAVQTISTSTDTVIQFGTESYDTDSCYDTGTYRFTPNVSGKYFLYVKVRFDSDTDWDYNMVKIRKNGSDLARLNSRNEFYEGLILTKVIDANGTTDYFDFTVRQESGSSRNLSSDAAECYAGAYKLIGL